MEINSIIIQKIHFKGGHILDNGKKIAAIVLIIFLSLSLILRFIFLKADATATNFFINFGKTSRSNYNTLGDMKNMRSYDDDIYNMVYNCEDIADSSQKTISQADMQVKCSNYIAKISDYKTRVGNMKADSKLNNFKDLEIKKDELAINIISTCSSAYFGNEASKQQLTQYESQLDTAESNVQAEYSRLQSILR